MTKTGVDDNLDWAGMYRQVAEERDRLAKALITRQRLADGTEPQVGQRVVTVAEVAAEWHMPHAHNEHVHEITSLLGGDTHLVECGPTQISVRMLRLAPEGAEVTCPNCRGWREQMARRRADAEVYRREQIGEIHRIKAELECSMVDRERLRRLIVESCAQVGVRDDEDNAHRAVQLLAREFATTQAKTASAERATVEAIAAWLEAPRPCGKADCESKYREIATGVRRGAWKERSGG